MRSCECCSAANKADFRLFEAKVNGAGLESAANWAHFTRL